MVRGQPVRGPRTRARRSPAPAALRDQESRGGGRGRRVAFAGREWHKHCVRACMGRRAHGIAITSSSSSCERPSRGSDVPSTGHLAREAVADALAEAFAYAWEHWDRVMVGTPHGIPVPVALEGSHPQAGLPPVVLAGRTPDVEPASSARSRARRRRSREPCGSCTRAAGRMRRPPKRSICRLPRWDLT